MFATVFVNLIEFPLWGSEDVYVGERTDGQLPPYVGFVAPCKDRTFAAAPAAGKFL